MRSFSTFEQYVGGRENIYCILWLLFSIKIQIKEVKKGIINKLCNEVGCSSDMYIDYIGLIEILYGVRRYNLRKLNKSLISLFGITFLIPRMYTSFD